MPVHSDVDTLIKYCTDGDDAAWSEFTKKFSRLIIWSIRNKIKRLKLPNYLSERYDIYQQVLLSIWQKQKFKNIKNPNNIKSWIAKVTQNETFDYLKSKKLLQISEDVHSFDICSTATQADKTHNSELYREIETFIGSLPLKERRIAVLNLLYDLKYEQISDITDMPLGTVSITLKRIKHRLKQHLLRKGCLDK